MTYTHTTYNGRTTSVVRSGSSNYNYYRSHDRYETVRGGNGRVKIREEEKAYFKPPSCKSFNFKKIAGFHEAAVKSISFKVVVVEIVAGVRVKKIIPIIFPQPVRFGVPATFNYTLLSYHVFQSQYY